MTRKQLHDHVLGAAQHQWGKAWARLSVEQRRIEVQAQAWLLVQQWAAREAMVDVGVLYSAMRDVYATLDAD